MKKVTELHHRVMWKPGWVCYWMESRRPFTTLYDRPT